MAFFFASCHLSPERAPLQTALLTLLAISFQRLSLRVQCSEMPVRVPLGGAVCWRHFLGDPVPPSMAPPSSLMLLSDLKVPGTVPTFPRPPVSSVSPGASHSQLTSSVSVFSLCCPFFLLFFWLFP